MTGSGPLYARLLRLRHLHLGPVAAFVLFEGSVLLAIVFALAELVHWEGVLVIPVAVAIMVKLNDVIAGVLNRPKAIAQIYSGQVLAIGRSPTPRPARLTTEIGGDDAVFDPSARPDPPMPYAGSNGVARGIASIPASDIPLPEPPRTRGNQGRFSP